jgi:hypothetical protein
MLDRWVARKDISTSLIAGNDRGWSIRTTASELYPALVLTAWFTNADLYNGLLLETLKDEERLTSRLSVFPDDYHLKNKRFARSSRNEAEILINASAYAGGLARIASTVGHSPWTDRLRGIVDAMFLRANVATDYAEGALPSNDLRVSGRILKTLPLLAELFEDEGYLYYARRIGDAYCVGVLPKNGGLPAERWNFEADKARASSLILNDDGVSFIEGLVGLYAVEVKDASARADIYRPTLSGMFDVLFKQGLKENGRFYRRLQPDGRGGYSIDRKRESLHTIRILVAAHRYGELSGNTTYITHAREALARYVPKKEDARDLPYLREASLFSPHASEAIDHILPEPSVDADQTQDAIALYALLAEAWSRNAGVRVDPWRSDLKISSAVIENGLRITLSTDGGWTGVLHPRHSRPLSIPAATGFPDQFQIRNDQTYKINDQAIWSGNSLSDGISIDFRDRFSFVIRQNIENSPSSRPTLQRP